MTDPSTEAARNGMKSVRSAVETRGMHTSDKEIPGGHSRFLRCEFMGDFVAKTFRCSRRSQATLAAGDGRRAMWRRSGLRRPFGPRSAQSFVRTRP